MGVPHHAPGLTEALVREEERAGPRPLGRQHPVLFDGLAPERRAPGVEREDARRRVGADPLVAVGRERLVLLTEPLAATLLLDVQPAAPERDHRDHGQHHRPGGDTGPPWPRDTAVQQGEPDLEGGRGSERDQRPAQQDRPLRRPESRVGGRREHGVEAAHAPEDDGRRSHDRDQCQQAGETRRGHREVDEQHDGEGDVAAPGVGEEEGEDHGYGRGGHGCPGHERGVTSRGQRDGDDRAHEHEEGEHVPVADRGVEAGVPVGVRHDVGHRLAGEGVDPDGRGEGDEAEGQDAQLEAAGRREPDRRRDREVEQAHVERAPGEVGPEGPGDGGARPERERGEDREGGEIQPRRALGSDDPDPDRGADEHGAGDGRRALQDVAAGEERERRRRGEHRDDRGEVARPAAAQAQAWSLPRAGYDVRLGRHRGHYSGMACGPSRPGRTDAALRGPSLAQARVWSRKEGRGISMRWAERENPSGRVDRGGGG